MLGNFIFCIFAISFVACAYIRWLNGSDNIFSRRKDFTFECECGHGTVFAPFFKSLHYIDEDGNLIIEKPTFECDNCKMRKEVPKDVPKDVLKRLWYATPPVEFADGLVDYVSAYLHSMIFLNKQIYIFIEFIFIVGKDGSVIFVNVIKKDGVKNYQYVGDIVYESETMLYEFLNEYARKIEHDTRAKFMLTINTACECTSDRVTVAICHESKL